MIEQYIRDRIDDGSFTGASELVKYLLPHNHELSNKKYAVDQSGPFQRTQLRTQSIKIEAVSAITAGDVIAGILGVNEKIVGLSFSRVGSFPGFAVFVADIDTSVTHLYEVADVTDESGYVVPMQDTLDVGYNEGTKKGIVCALGGQVPVNSALYLEVLIATIA